MNNSEKIILHLCADIGSDSLPYKEAGYDVRLIGSSIGVENYNPPKGVYGIIANPPCTQFSLARTRAKTDRDLREGMKLVKECLRIIWECQYDLNGDQRSPNLKFWALENPGSGFLRWFLGHPVFEYCQSEYQGPAKKRTALWGMFNRPARPLLSVQYPANRVFGKCKEDPRSMHGRSMCPINFAKAFFNANP